MTTRNHELFIGGNKGRTTNTLSYRERIRTGNEIAEYARQYKIKCWPQDENRLGDLSGLNEDLRQGRDYGQIGVCDFQAKKRETGADFGYEGQRWYKKKIDNQPLTFYTLPGRDARTQAIYTSTINRDETEIQICLTSRIHELVNLCLEEWNESPNRKYEKWPLNTMKDPNNGSICTISVLSDAQIKQLWLDTKDGNKKASHLFSSKKLRAHQGSRYRSLEIKGKIDEGGDRKNVNFLKMIFYIPYPLLNVKVIKLRKGEILRDPSTWQGPREENLDVYLPKK